MTTDAPTPQHSVVLVDRDAETSLIDGLKQNGWRIITLEGGDSVESFFIAARDTLPLDYPISGRISWDALDDSFSGGLIELNAGPVALLWTDADRLLEKDSGSFSRCRELLSDVEFDLEHERTARGTRVFLRSFLLGKGPQFQKLDEGLRRLTLMPDLRGDSPGDNPENT